MESICFIQWRNKRLQLFYFKIFLNYSKANPCPLRRIRKKPFDANQELWLVQKNHATVKVDSKGFSWNEKLLQKQNWTVKSTNLKENTSLFLRSEQTCEPRSLDMLPWILQELKEYAWKTCSCKHWRPFWFWSFGRVGSVTDGGNLCPLWLAILKSVWQYWGHLIAATQLAVSCSELCFAHCCVLKRTGTFELESKVMCLF